MTTHTVMLTVRNSTDGVPNSTVLGVRPAAGPALLPDDAGEEASNIVTHIWFFPGGSNHTLLMPATTP